MKTSDCAFFFTVNTEQIIFVILRLSVGIVYSLKILYFSIVHDKYRGGSRTAASFKMERFVVIVNGF